MRRLPIAAALCVLGCCAATSRAAEPTAMPLREVGITQKLDETVPLAERFFDEAGRELPLAAYLGSRPVILVPAYYRCPVLCTQLLTGLAGSLKGMSLRVGRDFDVVAVSFDPRETPAQAADRKVAVVRRYHRPGSESGWHFLTGREAAIARLMQSIGYRYSYDAASGQYAHAAGVLILTPRGRIARYFLGLDYAPRDLRLGLVEAAAGKIGTPMDRLLLYCFKYDPVHGRYGARIIRAVQLGAVLTVLSLLALIAAFLRWERRSSCR